MIINHPPKKIGRGKKKDREIDKDKEKETGKSKDRDRSRGRDNDKGRNREIRMTIENPHFQESHHPRVYQGPEKTLLG
jgi:hypothetical protein